MKKGLLLLLLAGLMSCSKNEVNDLHFGPGPQDEAIGDEIMEDCEQMVQ